MLKVHRLWQVFGSRELNEIYVSMALKTFAISMVSIFVPIYLVNLGYSFVQVFIYYAVVRIVHALSVVAAAKTVAKFGLKHAILFSMPFLILYYLALYYLPVLNISIYWIACLFGIHNALYWVGYHVDFARSSQKIHRGMQIGALYVFSMLFMILGPALGGLILLVSGFKVLYSLVFCLLLFSVWPLFLSKEIFESFELGFSRLSLRKRFRTLLTFVGFGIEHTVATVIWPIFLYFQIVSDFSKLGLISSLSILFSVVFVYFAAKFADYKRRLALSFGAILNSLVWIARLFVTTTGQVYLVDSIYGSTRSFMYIGFEAIFYDKANHVDSQSVASPDEKGLKLIEYVIIREIINPLAGALILLVMCLFTNLSTSFLVAAGASWLFLLF